jgi:hypothetical protein
MADSMKTDLKPIIGRASLVDFPELSLKSIPAKTDTGAYRSAIHAEDIEVITKDGIDTLHFNVLKNHTSSPGSASTEATEYRIVSIENSFGDREKRYEVKLLCIINGKRVRASFTLANRSKKKYPILIGRRLTNRRFLVDSALSQVDRDLLKQQYNIALRKDEEEKK